MSKYSNNGRKHNHEVLSPCTKESVVACLASPDRTRCMEQADQGYCGNGVLEEGEQCDCGDQFQCLVARSARKPVTFKCPADFLSFVFLNLLLTSLNPSLC